MNSRLTPLGIQNTINRVLRGHVTVQDAQALVREIVDLQRKVETLESQVLRLTRERKSNDNPSPRRKT